MQLSSNARKGLAAGLAASTILMTSAMTFIPSAFAAPHGQGCLVSSAGTVYLINNGVRQGITSADVFLSHGFNFANVTPATSEDMALSAGANVNYADGTLVKGPSDPLVYLVTGGQKRGFVSESAFLGLGFSFANVRSAAVNTFADLPTGANLDASSASQAHPVGVFVNASGTIWRIVSGGRQGIADMATLNSYGPRVLVPANAADLALPNLGLYAARVNCASSPVTTGPVSVSMSSDSPVAGTVIAGQATADMLHLTFTGSGTVTGLTLKRIGVSADSVPSNVYLFNGATRLTDAASVSSGSTVNFANGGGLFTVNGSMNVSVKADINSGATAGQTVGLQLTGFTTASGTTPAAISGNLMTVSSVVLGTVALSNPSSSVGNNTSFDPQNDALIWQSTATVATNDSQFSRMAVRETGSISYSDIKNFRLFVDGNQVAQVQSLDSNGYATFSFSPVTLKTGTRIIKVLADITGGSTRTQIASVRVASDLDLTDSVYGVHVTPTATGGFPATAGTLTISTGSVTVTKTTDSPASNVTLASTDQVLGRWTMTAFGEPVKVSTLGAQVAMGVNANTATTLKNSRILINGAQYGSTVSIGVGGSPASYTVNYTVYPNQPVTVELRADVVGGNTALAANDTITAQINLGSSNGTGQISQASNINVPVANQTANQVTVASTGISMAKQNNYSAQTIVTPRTGYKLAAFNLTGSTTEDVNVNTVSVDFTPVTNATFSAGKLSNVVLKYGGNSTSPRSTVSASGNTWSINYTLAKNAVVPVEIWADIASGITNADSMNAVVTITGTSNSGASPSTGAITGQLITSNTGSIVSAVDPATPVATIVADNQTVNGASFRFTPTNDTFNITDLTFKFDTNANGTFGEAGDVPTTATTVKVMDGATLVASKPAAASVAFTGLSIPVSSTKTLTVALDIGNIGVGAGTSGEKINVNLTNFKATGSNGAVTTDANARAGSNMYAYASTPVITPVSLPSNSLSNVGGAVVAKVTIDPQGSGVVSWKLIKFTVTKSANPVLTNAHLFNSATGIEVAGTPTLTTVGATNTSGSVLFVATNEQEISAGTTYELRMDVGSSGTGDSVSTSIAMPSAHAAPTDYTTVAGTTPSFAWSDESAAGHSTSTTDWNNDNLVKNLPSTSQSLSR